MNYSMEELMPVFEKLAEKYAGYESTSITYEKAEQLMEAILYCIREGEISGGNSVMPAQGISPQQAYETGLACVEKKTEAALNLYNSIMTEFICCENRCLYDTVVRGMPEFFKLYDIHYEPQNTILTLDYPVLADLSGYEGVDRIYEYLKCIRLEQMFLHMFPEDYAVSVLAGYNSGYRDMIENICEIILTDVLGHVMAEKPLRETGFEESDYLKIQKMLRETEPAEIRKTLTDTVVKTVRFYFEDSEELAEYLVRAASDIAVRLKNAAENGTPHLMF